MPSPPSTLRSNLKRILAGALALSMFLAMRRATDRPGAPDNVDITSRFAFTRTVLPEPEPNGAEAREYRLVHPAIEHIRAFFSTIGAAAALHDLDGNGLPDDLCHIDTLRDRVIVSPAPGTGDRYPAFVLEPGRLAIRDDGQVPSSCQPADLNEDGHADIVVAYAGRSPILYTWHPAPASMTALSGANFTPSDVVPGVVWTTLAINAVDLDGDGHLELVVVNYFADGGEVFNPHGTSPIELPASFSRAFNGGGVHILRITPGSEPDKPPVFTEVRGALDGIPNRGWGLALGAYDIDGDLLPELYVANDFGPDRFLWNRSTPGHIRFQLIEGEPRQSVPASKVIGHDSFKGMGVDFADLNGDSIPDLFVSNITESFAFQESQLVFLSTGSLESLARGKAPYVEGGDRLGLARSGWAWDAKLDDFDNDGTNEAVQATGFLQGKTSKWPELHELAMANDQVTKTARNSWPILGPGDDVAGHDRNPFYVRVGERYVDVGQQIGFGEAYPSRGIAIADVKGNGRLDMVVANMMAPATYYENVGTHSGAFLGLHLLLPARGQSLGGAVVHDGHASAADVPARPAIGAIATVTLPDGTRVSRQVDAGNGHTGKRSPDLHFGLGAVNGPVRVEIKWRDAAGIHTETRSLLPGWHTVILAAGGTS